MSVRSNLLPILLILIIAILIQKPISIVGSTPAIPNATFEEGNVGQVPTHWTSELNELPGDNPPPQGTFEHNLSKSGLAHFEGSYSMYGRAAFIHTSNKDNNPTSETWAHSEYVDARPATSLTFYLLRASISAPPENWGWSCRICLNLSDGANQVQYILYEYFEMIPPGHQGLITDSHDFIAVGSDGSNWLGYNRDIPSSLNRTHLRVSFGWIAHTWYSHTPATVEIASYIDNILLRTRDVAVTKLIVYRTYVDQNIWVADFPYNALKEATTGGGTSAAYNGFGNPNWVGPINQVLSHHSSIGVSVNYIHVYFLGNGTERDLAPTDYLVTPPVFPAVDYTVSILTPLDTKIVNETYIVGWDAWPRGWPQLQHNCSGIQSVYVWFPNGTERYAMNYGFETEGPPPSEWWYEPDWPYELESWWTTADDNAPWMATYAWPLGTHFWVNYTAASKIKISYNVQLTCAPLGEPLFINVTVSNQGDVTETFDVSLSYFANTDPMIGTSTVTLAAMTSTTLTFTFVPTLSVKHTVYAEAATVPSEIDIADNMLETWFFVRYQGAQGGGGGGGGNPVPLTGRTR